jgi:hypothetical protein
MRARAIKPGFYKNEALVECSLMARFIVPGLWMMCDRAGRMEDRPKRIKMELLPADDADMDALLDELARCQHLIRYCVNGKRYIQIVNFSKHQSPHVKEAASIIPGPEAADLVKPAETLEHHASTIQASCSSDINPPSSLTPSSLTPDSSKKDQNTTSTSQSVAARDAPPTVEDSEPEPKIIPLSDLPVRLVQVFDDCLAEVCGEERRRPFPKSDDLDHAKRFAELGVTPEWFRAYLLDRISRKQHDPPSGLKFFAKFLPGDWQRHFAENDLSIQKNQGFQGFYHADKQHYRRKTKLEIAAESIARAAEAREARYAAEDAARAVADGNSSSPPSG